MLFVSLGAADDLPAMSPSNAPRMPLTNDISASTDRSVLASPSLAISVMMIVVAMSIITRTTTIVNERIITSMTLRPLNTGYPGGARVPTEAAASSSSG